MNDIKKNPRSFDSHVHVETATATPMEVLRVAREKGLQIGLVDHVFSDEDRITSTEIKELCKAEYSDINFLHGCEADAYAPGKIALSDAQRHGMDFIIISFTHLTRKGVLCDIDITDEGQIAGRMMELLRTAVEYPHTDILGHPFSFDIAGIDSWEVVSFITSEILIKELQKAKDNGIAIEINARTLRNNDPRPQKYFIELANSVGCNFSIGSDAHELFEVGCTQESWALVAELKIPHERIVFPSCRR